MINCNTVKFDDSCDGFSIVIESKTDPILKIRKFLYVLDMAYCRIDIDTLYLRTVKEAIEEIEENMIL